MSDSDIVPAGNVLCQDRRPWERQLWESDRQWSYFKVYRDLPPDRRSLGATWRECRSESETVDDLPNNKFYHMAAANLWKERVEEYDRFLDEKEVSSLVRRRIEAVRNTADVGSEMMDKALEALRALRSIIFEEVTNPDGTKSLEPVSALSPSQIAQLARVGKGLEWDALGLTQVSGKGGLNLQLNIGVTTQQQLPDGELVEKAKKVLEARATLLPPKEEPETIYVVDTTRQGRP